MENYKGLYTELKDNYNKCTELFDIAYRLNLDENTRTAFSQKVTTYMPAVTQTFSYIMGGIEMLEEEAMDT